MLSVLESRLGSYFHEAPMLARGARPKARGCVMEKNKPDSFLDLLLWLEICALFPGPSCAGSAPFVKDCCLQPEIYRVVHSHSSEL